MLTPIIYYIYTTYMNFKKYVYICINTVYMKFGNFCIYTCIYHIYNDLLMSLVFLVNICLLLKILSLSVYIIYTLFVYILYIYTCI